jgi:hypothetical protein
MSGIFRDSFDHYQGYLNAGGPPVGYIGIEWDNITCTFDAGYVSTSPAPSGGPSGAYLPGRTGPQCMAFLPGIGQGYLTKTLTYYSNYFVGFAVYLGALGNGNALLRFNGPGLGSTPVGILDIAPNGTGGFDYSLYPGGTRTYGGSTANSLYSANEWFYLEVQCNPTGSNINLEVRVNAITVLNGTVGGPTNQIASIDVGAIGALGPNTFIDDFYINDDQNDLALVFTLTEVAVSGGNSVYTYSATGGVTPTTGMSITVRGFVNGGNDVGPVTITSATVSSPPGSGTFTVATTTQTNEMHAATATATPSIVTGFMGDIQVEDFFPNSDGQYLDWTPLSGMTHYTEVNEQYVDGDTSYVSTNVAGNIDTYGFPALSLPTGGTIIDIQAVAVARKIAAGSRTLTHTTYGTAGPGSGVTYTSPADVATPVVGTYTGALYIYTIDPKTGLPWTPTLFNDSQFGPDLNS